jgi:hypothetical protein
VAIAFAEDGSVVVNFGILCAREATQAELDRLALVLRQAGAGAEMTITAARRQDYGDTLVREGTTWMVAGVTESVDHHRVITMALPPEVQN